MVTSQVLLVLVSVRRLPGRRPPQGSLPKARPACVQAQTRTLVAEDETKADEQHVA